MEMTRDAQDTRAPGRVYDRVSVPITATTVIAAASPTPCDAATPTTMVVEGEVVNRPSDLTGPRAVSDALIVTAR